MLLLLLLRLRWWLESLLAVLGFGACNAPPLPLLDRLVVAAADADLATPLFRRARIDAMMESREGAAGAAGTLRAVLRRRSTTAASDEGVITPAPAEERAAPRGDWNDTAMLAVAVAAAAIAAAAAAADSSLPLASPFSVVVIDVVAREGTRRA